MQSAKRRPRSSEASVAEELCSGDYAGDEASSSSGTNAKSPAEIPEETTPIEAESEEHVPEAGSKQEENQGETEEVKIRKMALRTLVSDLMKRIVERSGLSYNAETFHVICDRLFEKLWIEIEGRVLSMRPEKITSQATAIFKDLLKKWNKAKSILIFLDLWQLIFEKFFLLSTLGKRL